MGFWCNSAKAWITFGTLIWLMCHFFCDEKIVCVRLLSRNFCSEFCRSWIRIPIFSCVSPGPKQVLFCLQTKIVSHLFSGRKDQIWQISVFVCFGHMGSNPMILGVIFVRFSKSRPSVVGLEFSVQSHVFAKQFVRVSVCLYYIHFAFS